MNAKGVGKDACYAIRLLRGCALVGRQTVGDHW